MAILDAKLIFSDGQAITSTAPSENVLDLGADAGADINPGAPNMNPGAGTPVYLIVEVEEAFQASGDATLTVALQDSGDNSSYADVIKTKDIGKAELTAGKKVLQVPLPNELRRYIRCNYTVTNGPMTAGKINAYLALAAPNT